MTVLGRETLKNQGLRTWLNSHPTYFSLLTATFPALIIMKVLDIIVHTSESANGFIRFLLFSTTVEKPLKKNLVSLVQ